MADRICEDWLESYLKYTYNSEPPTVFKTWCGISTICAALQRKCWMEWECQIYPNMYIVLVAPPGKGRKGTAMRPAQNFISALNVAQAPKSVSRSALIKSMVEAHEEVQVGDEIIHHNSISVFSSELSVFLGKENYELIATLTAWFDCETDFDYNTRSHGEEMIDGVWVNLLGATTPEYLTTALPQDAVGGGLTSRIVFVYGDKKSRICPTPFLTDEEYKLQDSLYRDLERIYQLKGKFEYTDVWRDKYVEWYIADSQKPKFDHHPALAKYGERRSLHLRKLCMAMSASRSNEMVLREADFDKAKQILDDVETNMPYIFSGRGRASHAQVLDSILSWLKAVHILSLEDIIRRYKNDATERELIDVIRLLHEGGYAEYNPKRKTLAYKPKEE